MPPPGHILRVGGGNHHRRRCLTGFRSSHGNAARRVRLRIQQPRARAGPTRRPAGQVNLQDDDSFRYALTTSGTPGKNSLRGVPTDSDRTDYPAVGASRVTVPRASGPGPTNNPPTFFGDQATRSVLESTGAGMNIGARAQRTDRDGDTPTDPQGGTDAASFAVVGPTGQLGDQ